MRLYGVSIVVQRKASERAEEISLGELSPVAAYITTETVHVCTRTFATSQKDAEQRAYASAREAWPRHEGWGEPHVLVVEIPISEKLATRLFREGFEPDLAKTE